VDSACVGAAEELSAPAGVSALPVARWAGSHFSGRRAGRTARRGGAWDSSRQEFVMRAFEPTARFSRSPVRRAASHAARGRSVGEPYWKGTAMASHSTRAARQRPLDGRAQAPTRAEEIMEEYRAQEARLTRRLRWVMVLVAAAAAFIVYAVSAGDASHAGGAIAGTLTCLAAGGQLRARRNKVRRLLESGAAREIAQRTAAAEAGPRPAGPPSLFSQQYCRVTQAAAGGRLQAGPVPPVFLVVIRDFQLAVVQAPRIPLMNAPVAAIEILKPRRQYLGAGTALRIGGRLWVFDFSGVYNAEQRAGFLRQLLGFGSLRASVRQGREINDRFVTALLNSGASAAPA